MKDAIASGISTADIVLSTGGVSVGDYDYVEEIIASLGGEIHIRAVGIKPGKPLTVQLLNERDREIPRFHQLPITNYHLPILNVFTLVCLVISF